MVAKACVICGTVFDAKGNMTMCSEGCREQCVVARGRRFRQEYTEKIAARNRRYRREHPEKIAALRRRYQQEHAEEIAARNRRYRQEHTEEIAARNRRYYSKRRATTINLHLLNATETFKGKKEK